MLLRKQIYKIIISGIVCATLINIHAHLTIEEQEAILEECSVPPEVQEFLDTFFDNHDARSFFHSRLKEPVAYINKRKHRYHLKVWEEYFRRIWQDKKSMKPLLQNKDKRELYWCMNHALCERHERYAKHKNTRVDEFKRLCEKYKMRSLNLLSPDGRTSRRGNVLVFDDLPGWVIKFDWRVAFPLRYQNVSRVFYNRKIRMFVEQNKLEHVGVFKKYLYHIPGRPKELCDSNYLVVAEKVPNVPTISVNNLLLQQLTFDENQEIMARTAGDYVRPEYEEAFLEIIQVITGVGLWDIGHANIALIPVATENDNNGWGPQYRFFIIDSEQPALGYCRDKDFFHKNPEQIIHNGNYSMKKLREYLMSRT